MITVYDIARRVAELGAESPDHVNEATDSPGSSSDNCYNILERSDGTVARCIVGQALHDLGIPDETLARYDQSGATSLLARLVDLAQVEPFDSSDLSAVESLEFVTATQQLQDSARLWGEAVQEANYRLPVPA